MEAGALEILVNVLKDPENREKSHRYAAVSVCELITASGKAMGCIFSQCHITCVWCANIFYPRCRTSTKAGGAIRDLGTTL